MKYLIGLIALAITGCYSKEPEKTGHEGKPIPTFSLLLPDSITYFHTKDITIGKPVVMYYFNPNCPYCKAQMEEIIDDMDELKDIQFCIFTNWPITELKKFVANYKLNQYPNIITGVDDKLFFSKYFDIPGVPYLAIYDKDLILKKAFIGKTYPKQISKAAFN